MDSILSDLKFGIRALFKHRSFTFVALLTLAFGIGANTAIFSLVNAVLIQPLPFPDSDRLVMIFEDMSSIGFPRSEVAGANFADWKAQQSVFDDMALVVGRSLNLTGEGEPERLSTYSVTANFFSLLGVKPVIGRDFTPDDDKQGGEHVAILSYRLWNRRFGAQNEIVGKEILLNGEKYTVIGVMPRTFKFLQDYTGLWTPAAFSPEQLADRDNHYMTAVARLKDSVTVEQANISLQTISDRIAAEHPQEAEGLKSVVVPLHEELVGDVKRPLMLLVVAAGLVLLIACANIANLQLSRASYRRREIAIRVALGAGRIRIMRQLLLESVLLALVGGALGLLVALWSFNVLKQLIPMGVRASETITLDLVVLVYAAIISLISGIIFGTAPALQASRVDLNKTLKQGTDRGSSMTSERLRGAFVVAEVALSIVLLVGAALLLQTVRNMRNQYAALKPESMLTLRTVLPDYKYGEPSKRITFYDQVLDRVKALPGVVSAAYTTSVPLQWKGGFNGFTLEGVRSGPAGYTNAIHRQISSNYFQVAGITLQQGRYLDDHDRMDSTPVVVINETMARQYWPGDNPLGKRFKLGVAAAPWVTIVGVVNDVRQMGMDAAVKAEMYFPYRQIKTHFGYRPRDLVVRTSVEPSSLVNAIRQEIHAVDPDQPISNVALMSELLTEETGARNLGLTLLMSFAAMALLLASLGIYGVLSHFVSQQTKEIGVRMALGAQLSDILRLVFKRGMRLGLLGIGIGLIAALIGTRLMKSLLFGISATDPITFVAIALLLALVGSVACFLPARRATKIDPLEALRYE